MKTEISNNRELGPGYARLKLTFGTDDRQRPGPEDEFLVAVEEFPSRVFLQPPGQDRWPEKGGECFHQPDAQSWDGDFLILDLGPSFTEAFRSKLHAFHVKSPAITLSNLRLSTAHITRPLASGDGINLGLQKKPEPIPEPPPEEEYIEEEPPLEEVPLPETKPLPEETPPPVRKSSVGKIILIILLILLLGLSVFLGWYFLLSDKSEQVETPPSVTKSEGSTPAEDASKATTPLAEVQALLRNQASPAELEEALIRLDAQAGAEDAVFLLAETLADSKPEHRTRYGAFFDPADTRPPGSIIKAPQVAYSEYETAKNAGDTEAAQKMDALIEWANANANENEEARFFLDNLPGQR